MITRFRGRIRLVVAALLILAGAACSTPDVPGTDENPAATESDWPTAEDRPIIWIESGALDLKTSDGTFIRGIAETDHLLMATHDHRVVPPWLPGSDARGATNRRDLRR